MRDQSHRDRIAVVGAGIVGASIAWHLAERGHLVVVFDAGAPGGGVTAGAFGWLNVGNGPTDTARAARAEGLRAWAEPPFAPFVDWCGSLHDRNGPGRHRAPEGHIGKGPAWVDPRDGAVDAAEVTRTLLDHPRIAFRRARVAGVEAAEIRTDADVIYVRSVIVASGLGSADLISDLPVISSPATLLDFGPLPRILTQIVHGWGVELRQRRDGRLIGVAGSDPAPDAIRRAAEAVLNRDLPAPTYQVWDRPMTEDGVPVLGRGPSGVFHAVGHPGVILAPVIGARVADMIGGP